MRAQIQSGELSPGDKLPSTSELCRQHDVSAIVVRQASNALKVEGLVEGVGGVGVFVVDE
ncbi:GntR family transcriptional regulator [Micromonospora sp. NPDC049060]|uniref:GntR family transcriptional regulator n=1 Tax=Micromonospora sp. NPDC049060 TaxID=3154828 RepID=UPI0033F05142